MTDILEMELIVIHIMDKPVILIMVLNATVVQDICVQHQMELTQLIYLIAFHSIIKLVSLMLVNSAIQLIFYNATFQD